jgi:hypothetical protein
METLVMIDQAFMGHHALLQRAAWARQGSVKDAGEAAQQLKGTILEGEESDWWIEKVPDLPGQSFQHLEGLNRLLEDTTYSRTSVGQHQTSVDSATQAMLEAERGDRKFTPYRTQLETLFGGVASDILKLSVRLRKEYPDEDVPLVFGEHRLEVGDIEDSYEMIADLKSVDAVVAIQQKQMAMQEVKDELMSRMRYFATTGVEDGTGEEKEIDKDRVRKLPEGRLMGMALASREMEWLEMAEMLEQRTRQGGGLVGPDGQPLGGQGQPQQPQQAGRNGNG